MIFIYCQEIEVLNSILKDYVFIMTILMNVYENKMWFQGSLNVAYYSSCINDFMVYWWKLMKESYVKCDNGTMGF